MPRTRKGAGKAASRQEIKSAEQLAKAARKRSRELLAKAGRDLREVRHEVSKLKKAGIVSKRIDARSYMPSRYMLSKLKANVDILSGEAIAVRAPKKVRRKYVEKGLYEERGSVLVVPREYANQRTRIRRGLVEVSRSLKMGEEIKLILPFKATDMEQVGERLKTDPTLDGMKQPDELFGFRLFGHNMNTIGFPSAEELGEYITTRYQHLFSGRNGREGVKHFVLFKFKSRDSQLSEPAPGTAIYTPRKRRESNERDWIANKRRERDALRKKKLRENETEAERKTRLDKQRVRQAQLRQRKFLGD